MNKKIGLGIVGICLASAAYFAFGRHAADEPMPDTDDSATRWMCRACQFDYQLTARKYEEAMKAAGGNNMPLICPKCGKKDAWRAAYCEKHSLAFLGPWAPGSTGVCPKCQPDAVPITQPTGTPAQNGTPALTIETPNGQKRRAPQM